MKLDSFINFCNNTLPEARFIQMAPHEMVFEECVKMNCFYCGKYGRNWRCPPNLPNINFPKMFSEFDEGLFVILSYEITDASEYESIRTESSIKLHKGLLRMEKWLYEHNCSTALSFGAGSCKLCKGGCGKDQCNNPYLSRSPIEATGINVLKSAKKYGVTVCFPPKEVLMRVGLVMWQKP